MDEHIVELRSRERVELVTTLRDVGPDASTLCSRWSAADIAAHLAVSEQALGLPLVVFNGIRRVVPAQVTRRVIERSQAAGERLNRRMKARGWDALLQRLANGPPRLYRYGTVAHLRLVEEWIHHEDVRRGVGQPRRTLSTDFEAALWNAGIEVARFPEFQLGRGGIELDAGHGRRLRIGDDAPVRLRVAGSPGELLLFFAGRGDAADVQVDGDDDVIRSIQPGLRV